MSLLQDVQTIANELIQQRQTWIDKWQDLSDFVDPGRGRFDTGTANDGKKRHQKIYNGQGKLAARTLSAGIYSGMTNPARPWFSLQFEDDDLSNDDSGKRWLQKVERKIYMYLSSSRSNFYQAIQSLYDEQVVFNTAALYQEDRPAKDGKQLFKVLTCGTYAVSEGPDGRVDTLYREMWMSARAVVEKFGDRATLATRQLVENKTANTFVRVCHLVWPRKSYQMSKVDSLNMPWASVYWEYGASDHEGVLSESGFNEFPFHVVRWDTTGEEVYGRGPSDDALNDIKSLQEIDKAWLVGVQKAVDPPVTVTDNFKDRITTRPGGINKLGGVIGGTNQDQIKRLYDHNVDLEHIQLAMDRKIQTIGRFFFNDLFLAVLDKPGMTATEVIQRTTEKLLQLGPVIERQEYELLGPVIERTFAILQRDGQLPPAPDNIAGANIKIEYVSIMAQTQKMTAINAVQAAIQFLGYLAGMQPEIMDRFDTDEAFVKYCSMMGIPMEMVRSDDDVAAIRQQRAEQQAQQAQMQKDAAAVQAAEQMSRTQLGGGSLLDAAVGGNA
jgi:hypothetical protein